MYEEFPVKVLGVEESWAVQSQQQGGVGFFPSEEPVGNEKFGALLALERCWQKEGRHSGELGAKKRVKNLKAPKNKNLEKKHQN